MENYKVDTNESKQDFNLDNSLKTFNLKGKHCSFSIKTKVDNNKEIESKLNTVNNTNKLNSKNKMVRLQQFVPNIFNGSGDECILELFEYLSVVAVTNDWLSKIKLTYYFIIFEKFSL